jgi:hypothetical protein
VKLGQFLADAPEAPHKEVTFKVIGRARGDGAQTMRDVTACFQFITQPDESKALSDADEALAAEFAERKIPPPPDIRNAERIARLLYAALRDKDDPRAAFAGSVDELKKAIPPEQVKYLFQAYREFVAEEFPDTITAEGMRKLQEEAEKKS